MRGAKREERKERREKREGERKERTDGFSIGWDAARPLSAGRERAYDAKTVMSLYKNFNR